MRVSGEGLVTIGLISTGEGGLNRLQRAFCLPIGRAALAGLLPWSCGRVPQVPVRQTLIYTKLTGKDGFGVLPASSFVAVILLQTFPEWSTLLTLLLGMVTILNPLAVVPTWLNLTVDRDIREKRILIRRIVKNVFILLVFFLFLGRALLEFFGLTMVAIQFAGALYIMLTAINALLNQPKRLTDNALARDRDRDDISFTPMAMPLLVGPGVMGLMMGFGDKFGYPWSSIGSALTYAVILGFCFICCLLVFVTLSSSKYLERILGHSGLYGMGRIMSFILLALGCQMLLRSIQTVVLSLSNAP